MKQDALKQYVSLRDSIFSEREQLITRLREIDEALGAMGLRGRDTYYGPRTPTGRVRNELSLKEAVMKSNRVIGVCVAAWASVMAMGISTSLRADPNGPNLREFFFLDTPSVRSAVAAAAMIGADNRILEAYVDAGGPRPLRNPTNDPGFAQQTQRHLFLTSSFTIAALLGTQPDAIPLVRSFVLDHAVLIGDVLPSLTDTVGNNPGISPKSILAWGSKQPQPVSAYENWYGELATEGPQL